MTANWKAFWTRHARDSVGAEPQVRVLRTTQRTPVDPGQFGRILERIEQRLELPASARLLDLCCGNGLIAEHFASRVASVTCVDFVPELLADIDTDRHANLTVLESDALDCEFPEASFDAVICYAALQYFSPTQTCHLLRRLGRWLAPGGRAFLGDIPDAARIWAFFNTPERERAHFDALAAGSPVIGSWFHSSWLEKLADWAGLSAERVEQPSDFPYSHFRFDLLATRREASSRGTP